MAKNGHSVIATTQVSSQVTPLREEAKALGIEKNLKVERLDLTNPYDIAQALTFEIDVLWNNAGMGEAGPVWEIPVDLVRRNFEVNVFLPLQLTQGVVRHWIRAAQEGQSGLHFVDGRAIHPSDWGTYVSTKHALESIAEALEQELSTHGIKVQTINPGAYYTGYNETMADNPSAGSTTRSILPGARDLRRGFDDFFATPEGKMDPQEMIDRMVEIVPADNGKFRNVVPKVIEDMLKAHQLAAWDNKI